MRELASTQAHEHAARSRSPARARLVRWLREHLYVLIPCLVLATYAAPSIPYMLPAHRSYQSEDYQPLKTLKFWKSLGSEYHKYGPMTDILLGPGYALSMAYWWLTGSFERPEADFPYGFERPLEQMGFLLLQGRILFLLLVLLASAVLMRSLHASGFPRWQVALGFMCCFGTSWVAAYFAPNTRPEAPQFAFVALSLGCYALMIYEPPSARRAFFMSAWAALAITAKELAATVFVLPYAGYAVWLFAKSRKDAALRPRFWPVIGAGLGSGVLVYGLFNIAYAPLAWWSRIEHWLLGAGIDAGVWGGVGSGKVTHAEFAVQVLEAFVSALGPGGCFVACVALAALIVRRPPGGVLLLLPFVSLLLLGLIPIGYVGDRFYGVAGVALVPPVVAGLSVLWDGLAQGGRRVWAGLLGLALAGNLLCATYSWHSLRGQPDYLIESSLRAEALPRSKRVYVLDPYPGVPGSSRLALLGYEVEARSLQEIADGPFAARPDRVYATEGGLKFLEEARDEMPARAEMLLESAFRARDWRGLEALGYRHTATLEPRTPWWFPFDWLQVVQYERWVNRVLVFDRTGEVTAAGSGSAEP